MITDKEIPDINTNAVCPHCGGNDAVYSSIVCDFYCQLCGLWFETGEDN